MKNILLITIDSLRKDVIKLQEENSKTPFLSKLASDGIAFSQAYANGPRTSASFQSILSSRYPLEYGTTTSLIKSHVPIAEVLSEAGYHTVGFHSNPYLSTSYNYDRGFDIFDDGQEDMPTTAKLSKKISRYLDSESWTYDKLRKIKRFFETTTGSSHFTDSEAVNNNVENWITNNPPQPFFLWIHYMDVHAPYNPPREYLPSDFVPTLREVSNLNNKILSNPEDVTNREIQTLKQMYKGEVRYIDSQIRGVYRDLDEAKLLSNTAVFLTSDHGEEFGEDGGFLHAGRSFRKASKLRDELLHVPLIVSIPNHTKLSEKRTDVVSLIDLGPSILDIAGIQPPDSWQGKSILREPHEEQHVFSEYWLTNSDQDAPACSIRTGDIRIIYDGEENTYQTIPADGTGNQYQETKEALDDHMEKVLSTKNVDDSVELSGKQRERLRNLGYLVE
jgi:arylsulfatase A-like enzyme